MQFHGFTKYEQLIEGDKKVIQNQIIRFINTQKEKGLSSSSIGNYITALKHFYIYNDITDINWVKVKRFLGERQKTVDDRAYTHSEIRQILTKCDERKRVLVLLLASTGMRIGAIAGLKLGNIRKIPEANLYRITVYQGTKDEYFTYCTPECAAAIDVYLDYRRRYGEELNDNSSSSSPLIREQFDKKDLFQSSTRGITLTLRLARFCVIRWSMPE
jgi:site-specific recombinase XerD